MFLKRCFILLVTALFFNNGFSQGMQRFSRSNNENDIAMTWDKNTPESEMKDDIAALAKSGITIKYSGVKRNSKDEITAIKVEYADRKGNKGKIEVENANPIATIKFFKSGETIGFGEPQNGNDLFGNSVANGFTGVEDLMKQFQFNGNGGESQSYSFKFPNGDDNDIQLKTKTRIQKDGKKPLIIEDGVVVEGGDDYTKEELEEIIGTNKADQSGFLGAPFNTKEFDLRNNDEMNNFKKQMKEIKPLFGDVIIEEETNSSAMQKEMNKAKEEMIKAKEELEEARKQLEKSKTSVKTKKI